MSFLNISDWVIDQKRFEFVTFNVVDDISVDLVPLNDELIQKLKMCETAQEMVFAAADFGVSKGRERFCDDAQLAEYLGEVWIKSELLAYGEPSVKEMVGDKVCEISGLTDYIQDKRDDEELKRLEEEDRLKAEEEDISVGEHKLPGDITLGELEADAAAAA